MNIFVLDRNVKKCAQYHCDQHVSKMILESAQIMCTVLKSMGFTTPYKSTHEKHPCVLWVRESYANFIWLAQLALALNTEYKYRYEKDNDHASVQVIREIEHVTFSDNGLTEFVQAVPEKYKYRGNAVRAYRSFYRNEKAKFARWTKRPIPRWMNAASK